MLIKWYEYVEPGSVQNITTQQEYCLDASDVISIVSAIIGLVSAVICLFAFILALRVAKRDSKNHFETVVEDCLMPISVFIQDTFLILSQDRFDDLAYIREGEKKLVEGINKLLTFSIVNNYANLQQASTIHFGTQEKDERSFSYCLLELENKYFKYREKQQFKRLNYKSKVKMQKFNLSFRKYLKLMSKYLMKFRKKSQFRDNDTYFIKLKKIYDEVNDYAGKSN